MYVKAQVNVKVKYGHCLGKDIVTDTDREMLYRMPQIQSHQFQVQRAMLCMGTNA
jgi:hypothetical protein